VDVVDDVLQGAPRNAPEEDAPSLFQVFRRPTRPAVLFISMSCCA
jgi:hypothetical protein